MMPNFALLYRSVGLVVATVAWIVISPTVMAETPRVAKEHPLDPAIRWAESSLEKMKQIKDYEAVTAKRERVGDKLQDLEYAYIRVRHEPFSVYMYLLSPADIRGCQMVYVEGRKDGKMLVNTGRGAAVTLAIKPDFPLAMKGSRYPITKVGIKNLAKMFAKQARQDKELASECDVKIRLGAKVNGRSTTMFQITHKQRIKARHLNHMVRIFFDDELKLPTRYEAYDFPDEEGGKPVLLEEYTFLDVKLNIGFPDKYLNIIEEER